MNTLYQIFIYPLEVIMEWVLVNAYAMTDHYGAALFLLSLCVNVALLPLYHIAESWQQAERRVQKRMAPKLEEFQQVFSGEERFMMIKTLYRQHDYHPIYALRASFGFAIQVPFFIAAYHFLSHYQPFAGASFFLIKDLASPDALLGSINCLPFVMTGVNLLSAFIYSQHLNPNDKIQLWAISLLFLVLLYSAPAALVIYWTFNNIFSLLKNMVYARFDLNAVRPSHTTLLSSTIQEPTAFSSRFVAENSEPLKESLPWCGKFMQSPYVLALLVGVYPTVFYVSNNWYMFRASEGLMVWVPFASLIFLIMSVYSFGVLWLGRKLRFPKSETVSQIVLAFGTFLMLAYLLRLPILKFVGQSYLVFLMVIVPTAVIFAWRMPKITIFRVNMVLAFLSLWHLGSGLFLISTTVESNLVGSVGYALNKDVYDKIKFSHTPNVYYIVPDGYPNKEALEKIYSIDNSEFVHTLELLGFRIYPRVFSNYRSTLSSMAATLGMGHHYYRGHVGNMELFSAREFIVSKQNPVVGILKNNGYQVRYVHANNHLFTNGCFVDLCSPGLSWTAAIEILIPSSLAKIREITGYGNLRQRTFKQIDDIMKQDLPQFLYVHMGKPNHSPTEKQTSKEMASFRNGYIKKVRYAEDSIKKFVQRILKSDPYGLIIISADHGSRGLGDYAWAQNSEVLNGKSENLIALDHLGSLLAIRWPYGVPNNDQEIKTNVNSFRHILSYLSGKDDLLANKVDDHGYLLKHNGKDSVLVEIVHDGEILDHWVEKGLVN